MVDKLFNSKVLEPVSDEEEVSRIVYVVEGHERVGSAAYCHCSEHAVSTLETCGHGDTKLRYDSFALFLELVEPAFVKYYGKRYMHSIFFMYKNPPILFQIIHAKMWEEMWAAVLLADGESPLFHPLFLLG